MGIGFVGRDAILRRLRETHDEAVRGDPRVLLIEGAAGSGKTALVDQFVERSRRFRPRPTTLRGTCVDGGQPYAPLLHALAPLGATPAQAAAPEGADDDAGADERRLQLYLDASHAVADAAHEAPVVLVLDDCHWADDASSDLLQHLVAVALAASSTPEGRLTVVLPHRPAVRGTVDLGADPVERLRRSPAARTFVLGGLDQFELHDFVVACTGRRPSRALLDALAESSNGNPLLAKALLARLDAFGGLEVRGGRLAHRGGEEVLAGPADLDAVLQTRVAGLGRPVRELLTMAAFLGDRQPVADLVAVGGATERVERAIADAAAAGILAIEGERYRFDHPEMRQVLYHEPKGRRRRELHLRIADRLEARGEGGLDDPPRRQKVAQHLRRAGELVDPDRLLRASVAAAGDAARVAAYGEAARAYDAAIEASERLGEGATATRALLLGRAAYAHWYSHENETAADRAAEAVRLARHLGDLELESAALDTLARAWWSGEVANLPGRDDLRLLHEHLAAVDGRPWLEGRARFLLANLAIYRFDIETALREGERAEQLLAGSNDGRLVAEVAGVIAVASAWTFDSARGHRALASARPRVARSGDPLPLVWINSRLGLVSLVEGAVGAATVHLRNAMDAAPHVAAWAELGLATSMAVQAAAMAGDWQSADELAERAAILIRWSGVESFATILHPAVAWSHAVRGHVGAALAAADGLGEVGPFAVEPLRARVSAVCGGVPDWGAAPDSLPQGIRSIFDIAPVATAAEVALGAGDDRTLAALWPGIDAALTAGARHELGWGGGLARLGGEIAARLGHHEVARRWLSVAVDEARRNGAAVEAVLGEVALARVAVVAGEQGATEALQGAVTRAEGLGLDLGASPAFSD